MSNQQLTTRRSGDIYTKPSKIFGSQVIMPLRVLLMANPFPVNIFYNQELFFFYHTALRYKDDITVNTTGKPIIHESYKKQAISKVSQAGIARIDISFKNQMKHLVDNNMAYPTATSSTYILNENYNSWDNVKDLQAIIPDINIKIPEMLITAPHLRYFDPEITMAAILLWATQKFNETKEGKGYTVDNIDILLNAKIFRGSNTQKLLKELKILNVIKTFNIIDGKLKYSFNPDIVNWFCPTSLADLEVAKDLLINKEITTYLDYLDNIEVLMTEATVQSKIVELTELVEELTERKNYIQKLLNHAESESRKNKAIAHIQTILEHSNIIDFGGILKILNDRRQIPANTLAADAYKKYLNWSSGNNNVSAFELKDGIIHLIQLIESRINHYQNTIEKLKAGTIDVSTLLSSEYDRRSALEGHVSLVDELTKEKKQRKRKIEVNSELDLASKSFFSTLRKDHNFNSYIEKNMFAGSREKRAYQERYEELLRKYRKLDDTNQE